MPDKYRLTSTRKTRTLYAILRMATVMDVTAKKLVDKLREIRRQISSLQRQADSLKTSLGLIGVRPSTMGEFFAGDTDEKYAESLPFKNSTLVEACKRILSDYQGDYLDKGQVEYLALVGGYEFSTNDRKNSVDVTLRRLAKAGFCEVKHRIGPEGNEYRWIMRYPREKVEEGSRT
jgi:hypothetical protein